MAPKISYAKTSLKYPLYAAVFDPYNRGYLLVGGGGGEGRSGVPNKITLLDVSTRSAVEEVCEIDLPRTEDSVNTLASLGTSAGVIALAGINSTTKERENGQNEHFRTFSVVYPTKGGKDAKQKQAPGTIAPLSKCRVFTTQKDERARADAYQRILRLSPAKLTPGLGHGNKRIGAIATGLAKESELVVFNATVSRPEERDIIMRITPPEAEEVLDLDIAEPSEGAFLLVYGTDKDVFLGEIPYDFAHRKPKSKLADPRKIYSVPFPDVFESPRRAKFRFVRFLTDDHILLVQNHMTQKGKYCELVVMKVYPEGGPGEVRLRKKFSQRRGPCVGMDVCQLDADEKTGAQQIAIAVAGQDRSIVVLTIDYTGKSKDSFSSFRLVTTIKEVHAHSITKLVFSPFIAPSKPASKPYLFLASTSISHTVSVEHLPLTTTSTGSGGRRHLLSTPKSAVSAISTPLILIAAILLFVTFFLQSFLDYRAASTNSPAVQLLPDAIHRPLSQIRGTFGQLKEARIPKSASILQQLPGKAVLVSVPEAAHGEEERLVAEKHHDEETLHAQPGTKRWEDLNPKEKEWWKQKLVKAGEWAVDEGESVLKGVFFGEIAGAVGVAMGEALRG